MSARTQNLLIELLVEELPPKALKSLGEAFATALGKGLEAQGFSDADTVFTPFASPRRLALHATAIRGKAPDRTVQQKLMPVAVGLDNAGAPTAALLKKLAALGLDANAVPRLRRAMDGKSETLFFDAAVAGASLAQGLQQILMGALSALPIPKVMSYQLADGWTTVNFVRPVHGLVALHGEEVLPITILGLQAGRITQGHRFESAKSPIELRDADSYDAQLLDEGAVIAGFAARRELIARQLRQAAAAEGLQPIEDEALLDEVTALVERPNVLVCRFEPEYLEVPQECLILTMKANQKYFPLLDAQGTLTNKFLVVSNIRPTDAGRVIDGNERVVRPRLADAKFFFDQDRKKTLASRVPALGRVVYHNKLGTQGERAERVRAIAATLGHQLGGESLAASAAQAAILAKADLLTDMVGEFPELQGIMGRYYALADGLDGEIAEAIREQYLPRGAGDELPATATGMVLALADKIETLAGVFAIDQKPTGTRDPFGLRRAAIGLLRILIERRLPVDLPALIVQSLGLQPVKVKSDVAAQIYDYIMERLRAYYLEGSTQLVVSTEMFDAVLANRPVMPLDFDQRLRALEAFLRLQDAQSLAAANKRIGNILKKAESSEPASVREELLQEEPERKLYAALRSAEADTAPLFAAADYQGALTRLASLRTVIDAFFDHVMVMSEDPALRANRLALLSGVRAQFLHVADLSRLPG